MIYAYDPNLLNRARISLAWMFDYAVNDIGLELSYFYQLFLNSKICDNFQSGDSRTLAGMSGVEMACEIIEASNLVVAFPEPSYSLNRSSEYWLGWALSYYQWMKNCTFSQITSEVEIDDILLMYQKYHEMDISQFVEALDEMRKCQREESRLRRLRRYAGLSQSELAKESEVPLRTIQQYEQRQKNINHASFETILKLSKCLYCKPEDLLEQV